MSRRALPLIAVVALLLRLAAVSTDRIRPIAADGAAFVVTTVADTQDATFGDGICADSTGQCSLRAAVMESNAAPDSNVVSLEAPSPANYKFTLSGQSEESGALGDLDLKQSVTIVGRGPSVDTVNAAGLDRVFHVNNAAATAELKGLTVTGGAKVTDGGGVLNVGTLNLDDVVVQSNVAGTGGGVSSQGVLTVVGSVIQSNFASGTGGGIAITAPAATPATDVLLSVMDSQIKGNTSQVSGGGVFASIRDPYRFEILRSSLIANTANSGGGVWTSSNKSTPPSLIRDTTIATNKASENCEQPQPTPSATSSGGPITVARGKPAATACSSTAEGGGLANSGVLLLQNDTIVLNSADLGGGGVANGTSTTAGQTTVSNTIVALNTDGASPDNCSRAPLVSLGSNLENTPNDCGFDSDAANPDPDGDFVSTDPQLLPSETDPFGVSTFYPPDSDGPVVDAGNDAQCTADDQLGQPRPADGNGDGDKQCEIGAVELYRAPAECSLPGNTVCGTGGDDEMQGTDGDDILVGGEGDDHIVCGPGNDTVYADGGSDTVECDEGDDVIYGGPGDDLLIGGRGNDSIFSGGGNDSMFGDFQEPTGSPQVTTFLNARGEGKDKLYGEDGNDFGFGGGAFDRLFGGGGKDRMWGGDDDDNVKGQSGPDKLYGQDGGDTLEGGEGADELRAGDGRDLCIIDDKDAVLQSCDSKKRAHKRAH